MKKLFLTTLLFGLIALQSLNLNAQTKYVWTQKTSFPGIGRGGAIAFVAGNYAYLGLGSGGGNYLSDFYQYDFANDTWLQKASYPNAIPGAGAISNGTFGVVGLGTVTHTDCYKYNATSNQWDSAATFGGVGRYDVASFTIGNKGYIGMGIDNVVNYNDFWSYDFTTDTWSQIANIGGSTRYGCFSFVLGNKGYVGGGCYDNNTHYSDFYEYNPSNNTWTQKANFGGGTRSFASGFSMLNKGFAGLGRDGVNGVNNYNDFWSYNPSNDTWAKIDSFPGGSRIFGVSLSYNDHGYVSAGYNSNTSTIYNDFWQLDTVVTQTSPCNAGFSVFPDSNFVGLYFGYNYSTGTNISCLWNWGDGATDTGSYPVHIYANAGFYTITLTINGVLCADSFTVSHNILRTKGTNGIHKITILKPVAAGIQNDIYKNSFSIYPNPTNDLLNINLSERENSLVSIYNLNGQKLEEIQLLNKQQINTSNLEKGM
ncbi:MAG: hypothetical protein RJA07_2818, partial [Bacteroidota bacterium]